MSDVYEIEKAIRQNVNESDVLQKTNVLLQNYMQEELKNEKCHYDHQNDYLAHLGVLTALRHAIEDNSKKADELAVEYLKLKQKLLEIGGTK